MKTSFETLLSLLRQLEERGIHYSLGHNRDETIMITAVAPGSRWEIEVFENGEIEVEVFRSTGEIFHESKLQELLDLFLDAEE